MTYEKGKRKNEDERGSLIGWILRGLWYYSVVLPAKGTWWLTKQTAKGSWWLTKNAAQLGWAATVWTVNAPLRLLTWMWYAVMGLPPEFETQREINAYRLIRRRYRRRNFYNAHVMVYLLGMLVVGVSIIHMTRNAQYDLFAPLSSAVFFSIIWTLFLAFHSAQKRSGESEDRDLHEALEREYARQKRSTTVPVYEDYYRERLAEEAETNSNHTADYYEDNSDYRSVRKR